MRERSEPRSRADAAEPAEAEAPRAPQHRVVTSDSLFEGAREIIIRHGGDDYRLRLTRVGKLILNK